MYNDFQRRFIANSSGTLGLLIIIIAILRGAFTEIPFLKLLPPYITGFVCLAISYRERKNKSSMWHAYIIFFGLILIILNAALINGGFRAPVVAGVILLPLFSTIALGSLGRWLGMAAAFLCLMAISLFEKFELILPYQDGASRYIPLIYLGATAIGAQIIYFYEKLRIENENAILKLSEQFVASSRLSSLGEMAGGVAHEINNPLAIINGKIALLKCLVEEDNVEPLKVQAELVKIEKTVQRISVIVHGLLTFSRNSEGDPLVTERADKIASETIELCNEKFRNLDIDLIFESDSQLFINCRASQISQVIMNLLLNSLDAVESLSEKWVKLSVKPTAEHVQIVVMDSGHGIPLVVANRMMEPFFTTKSVGKGTGLGLSISRGIIEGHGGRLTYDQNSKNTCFVITIPLVKP